MPRLTRAVVAAALASLLVTGAYIPAFAAPPPSGPGVLTLQEALYEAGARVPLSARLGPATAAAANTLHVDPTTALHAGDTGPAVTALQRALTAAGYPVAPTGRFGPLTKSLVVHFEQAHRLPANGSVDLRAVVRATALYTVMGYADGLLGTPYTWGGVQPQSGFDCSGLVTWVYGRVGITLAHSSYDQWRAGKPVAAGELRPGDLVFFSTWAAGPSHVGIYIGDNEFVHAADASLGVIVSNLRDPYWFRRYVGARRVL